MDGGSVISGEDASSFFISNYPKHKEYIRLLMYYFIKIYLFISCEEVQPKLHHENLNMEN